MVERRSDRLNAVFQALAEPTRRAMLRSLAARESSIGQLAAPFHMSFAGAAKHVQVLENAGLIAKTASGRTHLCRLRTERLAEAFEWLRFYEGFWTDRLDALERELSRPDPKPRKGKKKQ